MLIVNLKNMEKVHSLILQKAFPIKIETYKINNVAVELELDISEGKASLLGILASIISGIVTLELKYK